MSDTDVLFFPWPIGAGHTGRCLVAAGMLRAVGLRCAFASDPTGGGVAREGFPETGGPAARRPRPALPADGYLAVASLDAAWASAGYYHPERIRRQVAEDRATLQRVRPRLAVTHMQPTAVLAARLEGIPVASIVEADFLPPGAESWMPWIPPADLPPSAYPASAPAFGRVLEELGLPPVDSVGELLFGDVTLVASTPELDPIPDDPRLAYVGPLIWRPDDADLAAELAGLDPARRPRVYVTLGSGEVSSASQVAQAAVGAAEAAGWSLLLATGYAGPLEVSAPPDSLVRPFGGLGAALEWADAVVCHGGHSTVLAGLAAGRPLLVAPALSENEANGRAMVEAPGAGFLLHRTEPEGGVRRVRLVARYPDLPATPALSAERLARAVDELLGEPAYAAAARRSAETLRAWTDRGPERLLTPLRSLL